MSRLTHMTEKYTIAMLRNPESTKDILQKSYPEKVVDVANILAKRTLELEEIEMASRTES